MCELSDYLRDNFPEIPKKLDIAGKNYYKSVCKIADMVKFRRPSMNEDIISYNNKLINHIKKYKHVYDLWLL